MVSCLLSFSRSQICIDAALVKPCVGDLTCNKQKMFLCQYEETAAEDLHKIATWMFHKHNVPCQL